MGDSGKLPFHELDHESKMRLLKTHSHTSNGLALEPGTCEEKQLKETQTLQQGKSHLSKTCRTPFVVNVTWLGDGMLVALISTTGTTPWRPSAGGVGARGLLTEVISAAPRARRTTGTRASCETKGRVADSAVGVRVGCAVPPSRCQLPCERYLIGVRWGFCSECGLTRSASPEQTRRPRRLTRVGQYHVDRA